ncbi:MAG: hypothetical protein AAFQ64_17475 [Pseudomonadota bacterium]
MMFQRLLLPLFFASPVAAQMPMTGAEFEAYVAGRIMSFGSEGDPTFGVEQYLPNRRVIWSTGNGECTNGVWYESKGDICFRYDGDPEAKCWAIYEEGDGLRAEFTTRPNTTVIFETEDYTVPLICGDLSS